MSGRLLTPKQYPADNVLVTYQPDVPNNQDSSIKMTTISDGKFLLQFAGDSTKGQLQFNLASQYFK